MYERTNLRVATETRPIRNMCVPNPFQNYAKSESLWNHGSDEVAILAATAISPTFTGRRTVTIMCNIPLHHLPLPFRNLVQDLLVCIFDGRRKPLDRLQVRPAFILERVADAINGEIEPKACLMLYCKEYLPGLRPGWPIQVKVAGQYCHSSSNDKDQFPRRPAIIPLATTTEFS
jgi:hypothetical protein